MKTPEQQAADRRVKRMSLPTNRKTPAKHQQLVIPKKTGMIYWS